MLQCHFECLYGKVVTVSVGYFNNTIVLTMYDSLLLLQNYNTFALYDY